MAFCANCGTEVQGKFCSKCGTPAPADAAGQPQQPQQAPQQAYVPPQQQAYNPQQQYAPPQGQQMGAQAPGLEENVACALCYALTVLTGIVFLVLAPYNQNKLIRFHAFQSIFVWVGFLIAYIAMFILSLVLVLIPVIGAILSTVLFACVGLGGLALWLLLMYKAYNREKWVLPIIGPLAEKQA